MIEDSKKYPRIYNYPFNILCSTQASATATTGWKLIEMLIDSIFENTFTKPFLILDFINLNLKTYDPNQKVAIQKY